MNMELISLIIGCGIIALFLLWIDIMNRRQKETNKIHKEKNRAFKNKHLKNFSEGNNGNF